MITERLERREERALIHSRLWPHTPQQTECTSSFLHLRPIQAEIKTFITLFEKYTRIYGLKMMKSEFKKAGTLQLKGIRRVDGELVCERRGSWWQQTVDILWRSMWILWMTSSLSLHSTSASVSELSRLVTHTAVSSPKCNSEKRPLSNSVAFQTLFKWHRYCGILKIHIVRKINTGIRYEPVYRPALLQNIAEKKNDRRVGYNWKSGSKKRERIWQAQPTFQKKSVLRTLDPALRKAASDAIIPAGIGSAL